MKIFNRGGEAAKAPQAVIAPVAAAVTLAAPKAPEPQAPDLTAILDANVKEMSEKIARLTSTIETQTADRSGFEQKLDAMEDRMRKLSSLTEMISAQYNPFVGDAPERRELPPAPEVGLAAPPHVATLEPTFDPLPSVPESNAALASYDSLEASLLLDQELLGLAPDAAPVSLPLAEATRAAPVRESTPPPRENVDGVHLWSVRAGFESSMVLLGWADWLLKSSGNHEGLVALVNYYHNIGWIGEPARDQLLAYAEGLAPPAAKLGESDWRAGMDVHERSLLFVEKLNALGARRSG